MNIGRIQCVTRFWRRVMAVMAYIAMLAIVIMMLLIVYDSVARYMFDRSTIWISDFVRAYLNTWIVMLGSAYILLEGGHVSVDLVVARLEMRKRRYVNIATGLLCATYCIIITWSGWRLVISDLGHTFSVASGLPMAPAKISIFLGFLFLSITSLMQAIEGITAKHSSVS